MEKFKCLVCKNEFESSKYYARYCSDRCRQAAYNQRLRDEKNQKQKPTAQKDEKDI